MAKRTIVEYVDDLDGTSITGKGGSFRFGLEGTEYEIDLTDANQQRLRDALAPFLAVARPVSARSGRAAATLSSGPSTAAVRAWAVERGIDVPERGRLRPEIFAAYADAHR